MTFYAYPKHNPRTIDHGARNMSYGIRSAYCPVQTRCSILFTVPGT